MGRKPLTEGQHTVTVSLRLTREQRATLNALGGAEWVRQQIDLAYPRDLFDQLERELLAALGQIESDKKAGI